MNVEDLDWLPPQGVHLDRDELALVVVALRALIDGSEPDEPNRAHAVTIAYVVADAIERTGESMSRPQLIEWLEKETGQQIDRPAAAAPKSRHVSIRVPEELFLQLEAVASKRGETVSQAARRMLLDGLAAPSSTEEAIDTAISSLLAARDRLRQ